jgi:chromate reductase, NAD(P)H dehydrogenase (quinone)
MRWPGLGGFRMNESVRILGIPGSLRKASFNLAALRAAQELLPPDATLEIFDLEGIPPFSEDDERTPPAHVIGLKARIREADAILIATPEYNYSVPGVLKNASTGPPGPMATARGTASRSRSWGRQSGRWGRRGPNIICARCSCFSTCTR